MPKPPHDSPWLKIPDETLATYNYHDCLATARVHHAQRDEMLAHGQWEHYRTIYWPLVEPTMAMAARGLRVDTRAVTAHVDALSREILETESVLPAGINLNSPKQRAELLYEQLGLKCGKRTDTGQQSTDVYALDWILRNMRKRDEHARPILHALFHRSRLNTILTRYLKLRPDPDGRVRPTIKLGQVETLRLAYAAPAIQQFPPEIRDIIVPAPGNLFVSCDYSQLEARILAILADDQPSLAIFAAGEDIHASNARDLFSYSLEEWNQLDPYTRTAARIYAKAFVYGISYGGRSETVKTKQFCPCPRCEHKFPPTLSISPELKASTEAAWFAKHPAVSDFRRELTAHVRRAKSYTTAFGYLRFFFAPVAASLPEIYNFPMQATAAGLVNERFIALDASGIPPALQLHDQILAEAPRLLAASVARQMRDIMQAPCRQLGGYEFPVSVSIGPNWRDLQEVEP